MPRWTGAKPFVLRIHWSSRWCRSKGLKKTLLGNALVLSNHGRANQTFVVVMKVFCGQSQDGGKGEGDKVFGGAFSKPIRFLIFNAQGNCFFISPGGKFDQHRTGPLQTFIGPLRPNVVMHPYTVKFLGHCQAYWATRNGMWDPMGEGDKREGEECH